MNATQFISYLNNPAAVDTESLKLFEELLKHYPYCQAAQLLYAFNLYKEEHPQYNVQLKKAAVYASDRRRLKRLIDGYKVMNPKVEKSRPTLPEIKKQLAKPAEVVFKPVIPVRSKDLAPSEPGVAEVPQDSSREKLREIVRKRLAEIEAESGRAPLISEPPIPVRFPVKSIEPADLSADQKKKYLSKEELIEKFILEVPKISSPRTAFLKPSENPIRSQAEDDEIVSETLAILYFKQGHFDKAERVYEKLYLVFPEKSSYFATRIKEMKAQHPNNNPEKS
ncbi:MAG: hypothetical protein V1733_00180 [bacterium]